MINKVVVMNLERRIDKFFFVAGGLRVSGFPIEHSYNFDWDDFLVRSISCDGESYVDAESVCKDAVDNGFKYFPEHLSAFDPTKERKYLCAWAWTWARTLREIAERDETVMLLIDDTTPAFLWTYERYCRLADEPMPTPVKAIQLATQIDRLPCKMPPVNYFNSILGTGFMGSIDHGLILNRSGAELLLEVQAMEPFMGPANDLRKITEWGLADKRYFDGLYHTLDFVIQLNHLGESDLHPPHILDERMLWV